MSQRSKQAISQTPAGWKHVNIIEQPPGGRSVITFKLTTGVFDSLIGWQTCKAAGIEKSDGLKFSEALTAGAILEKWLEKQNPQKEKTK